jgi:hypothetical protein
MDSVSHKLAIWTLVLVAIEVGVLVPTMLREIADFLAKKRRRVLRQIFDKNGPSYPISFASLLDRTKLNEAQLSEALYDLRERGEIHLVTGDCWIKTVEAPTTRKRG